MTLRWKAVTGVAFAVGLSGVAACDSGYPPTESAVCQELTQEAAKAPRYPAKILSCRKVNEHETATTYAMALQVELQYPKGSFPHCVSNSSLCSMVDIGPRVAVGGTYRTTLELLYHKTSRGWKGGPQIPPWQ
jgi:hypothetical protein